MRLASAASVVKATVVLAGSLKAHQHLCQIIGLCGQLDKSKWTVLQAAPAQGDSAVTTLASFEDARTFLQKVRRFARASGLGGSYF